MRAGSCKTQVKTQDSVRGSRGGKAPPNKINQKATQSKPWHSWENAVNGEKWRRCSARDVRRVFEHREWLFVPLKCVEGIILATLGGRVMWVGNRRNDAKI